MLKLYEFDTTPDNMSGRWIFGLGEAVEVKLSLEINGAYTLDFKYPMNNGKAAEIQVNRIVECEGQLYRILSAAKSEEEYMLHISCLHIYDCDAMTYHIPKFEVMSGVSPREVMLEAFKNTKFNVLSYDEVESLGMQWVGFDGFLVDFDAVDKTSPHSVTEQLITAAGVGEIYKDNYNIALVMHIGDTNLSSVTRSRLKLETDKNLSNLVITKDISGIVNRLYVYGSSDCVINSVNPTGKPYIESADSIEEYGLRVGYKDFSDCKNAVDLYNHACWEFSSNNEYRIDFPAVTIEANVIDLSKLTAFKDKSERYGEYEEPTLGKVVDLTDGDGTRYIKRITKLEYYPYEPRESSVTIGQIKKDEVFYLSQMAKKIGFNWRIR